MNTRCRSPLLQALQRTPRGSIESCPHLPRETQVYRPEASSDHHDANGQPCGCTACGGRLRLIGQGRLRAAGVRALALQVIRHVRPKLACVACESIFQAPAPSRPIARGVAGPGLLANVLAAHAETVQKTVARKSLVLGIEHYGVAELQAAKAAGEMLQIRVLGLAVIDPRVSRSLALATIESITVLGALHASPAVKAALADRLR